MVLVEPKSTVAAWTMDPFSSGAFGIPELKTQFVRNKSSINGPFLLRSHVKSPGVQTRHGRSFSFAFNSFLWVQREVSEGEPPIFGKASLRQRILTDFRLVFPSRHGQLWSLGLGFGQNSQWFGGGSNSP